MPDAQPVEQIIIVTGRGIEAEERLAATRTIDRAAIERSASGRIEDVLRDVAGLASFRRSDSRSANPTSQGLTLRGLGGNAASRVTLSLDGVPQADPFGGWIAFGALDSNAIDRIRITRGGGTEAVAGTIAIDSRKPDRITGSLLGGSRQSLDARALVGMSWRDGFASLSGSLSRGDGFVPIVAADRGPADRRAPFEQANLRARLVQQVGEVEAQANLSTYATAATGAPISPSIASAAPTPRFGWWARAVSAGRRSPISRTAASTASSPRSTPTAVPPP